MNLRSRLGPCRRIAALLAGVVLAAQPAAAHETDNFTLPAGRQFADLGPFFTQVFHRAISDAVVETNRAIEQAQAAGATPTELAPLQSAETIAGKVWEHMFVAIPTNELLDAALISQPVLAQYPGLVTMYRPPMAIYDDPLLAIDLTKLVRTFFRAGSVNANGVEFGTDKLIHFINVGRIYHAKYEARVGRGMAPRDAMQSAIASTARNPLTSEDGMLGIWTTGIHSNGDLAADYAGLLFYRNLTEPVRVGARELAPILVRDGELWRVQAERDSDFLVVFITPHWNEVLNPNRYVRYFTPRLRTLVRERCDLAIDWYRDEHGHVRDAAQFDALARQLSTYFGEPYGHEANRRSAVTLSTVCFTADSDALAAAPASAPGARAQTVSFNPTPTAAASSDVLGRSALWWAARGGQVADVQRLAAAGANANAADVDGETALHAAVRAGSAGSAAVLLANGAQVNTAAQYDVTPLMLATARADPELVALLLRAGADPNARDVFGQTPLHVAALRGNARLASVLVNGGADPTLANAAGQTPGAIAQRRSDAQLLAALREPTAMTAASMPRAPATSR